MFLDKNRKYQNFPNEMNNFDITLISDCFRSYVTKIYNDEN